MVGVGCHSPLGEERAPVDEGSFGTTVLTLVCKRFAYADDLADGGTTDVRGDGYRDICRLGLAAPDAATAMLVPSAKAAVTVAVAVATPAARARRRGR